MPDPTRLLFGPYRPPRCRLGRALVCEVRGEVTVCGITDARIPWPVGKRGRARSLVVCGGLAKAVRRESGLAVCHWWGVTPQTVTKWRKALGVGRVTAGTRRVFQEQHRRVFTPEARRADGRGDEHAGGEREEGRGEARRAPAAARAEPPRPDRPEALTGDAGEDERDAQGAGDMAAGRPPPRGGPAGVEHGSIDPSPKTVPVRRAGGLGRGGRCRGSSARRLRVGRRTHRRRRSASGDRVGRVRARGRPVRRRGRAAEQQVSEGPSMAKPTKRQIRLEYDNFRDYFTSDVPESLVQGKTIGEDGISEDDPAVAAFLSWLKGKNRHLMRREYIMSRRDAATILEYCSGWRQD
jgi:hypothetical protein